MDYNKETILDGLNDLENSLNFSISPVLEDYLLNIAKTGDTIFPWVKLKPLIKKKLEIVLDDFYSTFPTDLPSVPNVDNFKFDILKCNILDTLNSFYSAPFTIQRICELLTVPRKNYKCIDKFMRGLEKTFLVVSTVEPKSHFNEVRNVTTTMLNGVMATVTREQNRKRFLPTNKFPSVKVIDSPSQLQSDATHPTAANEVSIVMHLDKRPEPDISKDLNSSDGCTNNTNVGLHCIEVPFKKIKTEPLNVHHRNEKVSTPNDSLDFNGSTHSMLDTFPLLTPPAEHLMKDAQKSQSSELTDNKDTICDKDNLMDFRNLTNAAQDNTEESTIVDVSRNIPIVLPSSVLSPKKKFADGSLSTGSAVVIAAAAADEGEKNTLNDRNSIKSETDIDSSPNFNDPPERPSKEETKSIREEVLTVTVEEEMDPVQEEEECPLFLAE